jgi:hypothetical protein
MSTVKSTGLPQSNKPAEIEEVTWNVEHQSSTVCRPEEIGKQASTLVRQISLASTREIDRLTDDLKDLRKRLENRGSRIQNDIVEYAELSQSAVQLTKIVTDSVAQVERMSSSASPSNSVKAFPAERLASSTGAPGRS